MDELMTVAQEVFPGAMVQFEGFATEEAYRFTGGNDAYIFPGLGVAVVETGARRITDGMFLAAAGALAEVAREGSLAEGAPLSPLERIRDVSAKIPANQ